LTIPAGGVSELATPGSPALGDPRAALLPLDRLFVTDHLVDLDAGRFGCPGHPLRFLADLVQQLPKFLASLELCLPRARRPEDPLLRESGPSGGPVIHGHRLPDHMNAKGCAAPPERERVADSQRLVVVLGRGRKLLVADLGRNPDAKLLDE